MALQFIARVIQLQIIACVFQRLVRFVARVIEPKAENGNQHVSLDRAGHSCAMIKIVEKKCTSEPRIFENVPSKNTLKPFTDSEFEYEFDVDGHFKFKYSRLNYTYPEPDPDFLIYVGGGYFNAYSLNEENNISLRDEIFNPFDFEVEGCFIGSCNDVLFFENMEREHLLWNPTTDEFKILPKPFEPLPPAIRSNEGHGFWFDHVSQDYKLVVLVMGEWEVEEPDYPDIRFEIDLYSLKNNSWKKFPCTGFFLCHFGLFTPCIKGVYYCEAYRRDIPTQNGELTRVILSFDISTETISSLPLPDFDEYHIFWLLEYNGLLSFLVSSQFTRPRSYQLWVLNNGSWTKESVFDTTPVKRPLCFWKNGRLLFFESLNRELVLFDRATGFSKHLGIYLLLDSIGPFPFSYSSVHLQGVSSDLEEEGKKEEGQMIEAEHRPL